MGLCISLGLFMWKLWERKKGKGASYLHAWGNICSTSETQIIVCIMVTSELLMKGCQTWKLRNQCLRSWDTSPGGLSKQPGSLVHADQNQSRRWSRAGTALVIFRVILRSGEGKRFCLFVFHRRFSWLLNTQTGLRQHLGHACSRGVCWKSSITHAAGWSSHVRNVQTELIAPWAIPCQHRARHRLHLPKGLVRVLLLLPAKCCLPIAPAERGGWTAWNFLVDMDLCCDALSGSTRCWELISKLQCLPLRFPMHINITQVENPNLITTFHRLWGVSWATVTICVCILSLQQM